MGVISQWKGVSGYMLDDPNVLFAEYDETHGVGYPLTFLLLTYAVAMFPLVALSFLLNVSTPVDALLSAALIAGLGLLLWFATVVEALISHVIASLLGARGGVSTTLEAYAFPSIVRYGLWWVPIVNIGLGLYGLYLQIKGIAAFHDISTGRAALAALAGIVLYVPVVVLTLAVLVAFVSDLGGPT